MSAILTNWKRPCVIDNTAAYIAHREAIGDPMSEAEHLHWQLCKLHGIQWPVRENVYKWMIHKAVCEVTGANYTPRGWLRYVKPLRAFQMALVRGLKPNEY